MATPANSPANSMKVAVEPKSTVSRGPRETYQSEKKTDPMDMRHVNTITSYDVDWLVPPTVKIVTMLVAQAVAYRPTKFLGKKSNARAKVAELAKGTKLS
jgi:hypothetical protein